MSGTRLDLALQDVAEAAAGASSFGGADDTATVQRLTARVRRRRSVRGGTGAAVAAVAAGAVALVVPQLTLEVAPAADPGARPGHCRSAVTAVPASGEDLLTVALGRGDAGLWPRVDTARAQPQLGTWDGGSADLLVNVTHLPEEGVGARSLRLLVTQGDVVVATADHEVSADRQSSRAVFAQMDDGPDRVVDWPVHPLVGEDAPWVAAATSAGDDRPAQPMAVDLVSCDSGGPLPDGTYQVWATVLDQEGTARGAAGPWQLDVTAGRAARSTPPG